MKKVIITLLCLLIVSGGGYAGYKQYQKSKDSKRVVDVVPVSTLSSDVYYDSDNTTDGSVSAGNSQKVYLDNEKLVEELKVSVGDTVQEGDVLLTYDMTVVELELETQKNEIAVIEQQIKDAEKELAKYKTLQPSENAPKETEEAEEPEEYPEEEIVEEPEEEPTEEETEEKPEEESVTLIDRVSNISKAAGCNEDGAYQFNCSSEAAVGRIFMKSLKETGKSAVLNVYDDERKLIYMWKIDGTALDSDDLVEWNVSDGVVIENGTIYCKNADHGSFVVYTGTNDDDSNDDDIDDDDSDTDDDDSYDYTDDDDSDYYNYDDYNDYDDYTDDTDDDSSDDSEDYIYTKAELQKMIRETEGEIKELEISKKSAELSYKESKNRKEEGEVTATINGTVIKVGSESSGESTEDEYTDDEYSDDSEESTSDEAYIVIQGEDGIILNINVGELSLDLVPVGTQLECMSYDTGESFTAEVTEIEDEPVYYSSYNYYDNPNSSTFNVKAKVLSETSVTVDSWVSVTLPTEDTTSGLFLPMQYVHSEGERYYVMRADENNKLEKVYVKTGKVLWGSYIEIKGGIELDDMICFPYGYSYDDSEHGQKRTYFV